MPPLEASVYQCEERGDFSRWLDMNRRDKAQRTVLPGAVTNTSPVLPFTRAISHNPQNSSFEAASVRILI